MQVKEASAPSDIIWENCMVTNMERRRKKCIVSTVILAVLCISFMLIFILKKKQLEQTGKYPKVNCSIYKEEYAKDDCQWIKRAILEYQLN